MAFPSRAFVQLTAFAAVALAASDSDVVADDACSCYLTNGTVPAYYSRHMFFDFRYLGDYAGVPNPVRNQSRAASASTTSEYFDSEDWTSAWGIQDWSNRGTGGVSLSGDASVLMVNSPSNVYIEENDDDDAASDTLLTMRTMRLPGFQTAAEFESIESYQYLSVRMLARVTGSPGACMALFTYYSAEELADIQEADIEILTRDPKDRIQYTNQPSYTDDGDEVPEATRNGSLPDGLGWDNWLVHRLDWTPKRSVWYVNGAEVANISFQTPKDPALIILNAWSDGGEWSGNMSTGGAAYLQIQWLEMVYNASDSGSEDERKRNAHPRRRDDVGPHGKLVRRDGSGSGSDDTACKVVCSIDEAADAGASTILWSSTASRLLADGSVAAGLGSLVTWVLGVAALLNYGLV
ncbi:putative xylanase 3 [Dactylonectria estremocensis]|uniref:Xylanase 3 n=1 Tax=Dactylonectria estremocensis TaxID=1079267 RepID=A0A9P9JI23_9HYPO|nr:putative xylanase 3 [Dactylonectria estremocensis]